MKRWWRILLAAIVVSAGIIAGKKYFFDQDTKPQIDYSKLDILMQEHAAIGNPQYLQTLLDNGAPLDVTDEDGRSLLMLALRAQNFENAEFLLAKGADLHATAYNGSNALMLALEENRMDTVQFLLKHGINVEQQNELGQTALMLAARLGRVDAVSLLLKHGAKLEISDSLGENRTALYYAVFKSQPETMKLLLQAGANPNLISDTKTQTPLLFEAAAVQSDPEVLRVLLNANGLQLNHCDTLRQNALLKVLHNRLLFRSESKGQEQLLIEAGIRVNHADSEGNTALMYAAALNDYDLVQLLLKHHADTSLRNRKGQLAYQFSSDKEIRKLLDEKK